MYSEGRMAPRTGRTLTCMSQDVLLRACAAKAKWLLHVPRGVSVGLHVSRADRASSFNYLCPRELSVCLHLHARIKSWACVCILWLGSWAERACMFQRVSRAECVSAFGGLYQELSTYLYVSTRVDG